jgi:hypothetical protein
MLPWNFIAAFCISLLLGLQPAWAELCNGRDKVLVKMGTHLFAVPWKSSALYLNNNNTLLRTPCYHDGDPPVEVTYAGFSASGEFSPKYENPEIFQKLRESFSLRVGIMYRHDHTPVADLFEIIIPELQEAGLNLSSLPKEGAFYVWKSLNDSYYIAAKKDWVTPSGHPVTIHGYALAGGYTARVYWKDNIAFDFHVRTRTYLSVAQFEELYRDFLNYMESLEVKPDSAVQQTVKP